ncbi:hypothetical protein [Flavobacterium nitrogenifigens]|uniref:Uncharacterized protein n=1 Tax=Flavobacterium nitrogenifigens TaxID=1617283 RepID=A0A521DZW1_9FLAO|nr:hypothetical protein [Flavobacterium nitrogenifigens]KAF2333936.1 hypothetical protein DM397_08445 [Flavobacterium nitrogenifigens]SMO77253.1 hypothetical protein SAMN06265220_103694 [Flavobacterium nitrogenifigens]
MNGKKITISLFLLGIILCLFTISIYLIKFGTLKFSDKTSDWVDFADYFSGILNPIIAILNLVFFAYLSFKIINIEDSRNNWTLQELARPYGDLLTESTVNSIELSLHNVGLGPLILTDFRVYKDADNSYKDFYYLINDIADQENISPDIKFKIDSFELSSTHGAIAKDKSICIFKIYFINDNMKENQEFIKLLRTKLDSYYISITYEDLYGREIECINERLSFNDWRFSS